MFILINCQVLQSPVSKWWTQTQVSHKGLIIKRMAKIVNLPWFNGHRLTSLYKKKITRKFTPLIEFTRYQPERSWDTARCPEKEFFVMKIIEFRNRK